MSSLRRSAKRRLAFEDEASSVVNAAAATLVLVLISIAAALRGNPEEEPGVYPLREDGDRVPLLSRAARPLPVGYFLVQLISGSRGLWSFTDPGQAGKIVDLKTGENYSLRLPRYNLSEENEVQVNLILYSLNKTQPVLSIYPNGTERRNDRHRLPHLRLVNDTLHLLRLTPNDSGEYNVRYPPKQETNVTLWVENPPRAQLVHLTGRPASPEQPEIDLEVGSSYSIPLKGHSIETVYVDYGYKLLDRWIGVLSVNADGRVQHRRNYYRLQTVSFQEHTLSLIHLTPSDSGEYRVTYGKRKVFFSLWIEYASENKTGKVSTAFIVFITLVALAVAVLLCLIVAHLAG